MSKSFRGKPACTCLIEWLPVYEKMLLKHGVIKQSIDIYQLIGGATASAGTHSTGGAFDIEQHSKKALEIAREMGAATWARGPKHGMTPHAHGVLKGCPHAAYSAKAQVASLDRGRDGLARNGPDDGPRTGINWPLRTYKQGLAWAKKQLEEDMPLSKTDIDAIAKAVWEYGIPSRNNDASKGKKYQAQTYLAVDNANIHELVRNAREADTPKG